MEVTILLPSNSPYMLWALHTGDPNPQNGPGMGEAWQPCLTTDGVETGLMFFCVCPICRLFRATSLGYLCVSRTHCPPTFKPAEGRKRTGVCVVTGQVGDRRMHSASYSNQAEMPRLNHCSSMGKNTLRWEKKERVN